MEQATVETLLKGVGVIIDDDAEEPGKLANNMLISLQNANIPMVVYKDIPDSAVISSFGNISFIILDWEFSTGLIHNAGIDEEEIENVRIPQGLREENKRTILDFLQFLLHNIFVPIFIITEQDFESVKSSLIESGVYSDAKPNRIMLKSKSDITDYHSLMENVKQWLENVPSAYVLKLWESEAVIAKNRMFMDLFAASPNWVSILLRILKEDADNKETAVNQEFLEILNNNFVNRFSMIANYCAIDSESTDTNPDDIRRVLEGERYLSYDVPNDDCYTGDLYYIESDHTYPYRLNIRAQCDLSRNENPRLYLLSGKVFDQNHVIFNNRIKIGATEDHPVLTVYNKQYSLNDLIEEKTIQKEFNNDMQAHQRSLLFIHNEIIERKTHSIIACVAGKAFIEFDYREFEVMCENCLKDRAIKIGRILPPYITKIQNAFAAFMIRPGVMPIPEELIK